MIKKKINSLIERAKELVKDKKKEVCIGALGVVLVGAVGVAAAVGFSNTDSNEVAVNNGTSITEKAEVNKADKNNKVDKNKTENKKEDSKKENKKEESKKENSKKEETSSTTSSEGNSSVENKSEGNKGTSNSNTSSGSSSSSSSSNSSNSGVSNNGGSSSSNSGSSNSNSGAVSTTSKPSKPSTGGSSSNSGTTSKPSHSHSHSWNPITTTVHHDEVGHWEDVLVQDAWVERIPVYDEVEVAICNGCGADITSNIDGHMTDNILAGNMACTGWHTDWRQVQVGTEEIKHGAVYDKKYVVDKAAWDETVTTGYQCSSCGETK